MKKKTSTLKKASLGEILTKATPQVEKYAPIAGKLVQGIQALKDQKTALANAEQMRGVSNVALQASMTRPEQVTRKYVRPEDTVNTGEEFFPIYGVGTNVLAKNGKAVKGKKKANSGIDMKGFNDLSGADMVERIMTGITDRNPGGMVGGAVGKGLGTLTGIPGAGIAGQLIGQGIGTLANLGKANKLKDAREDTMANVQQMGLMQGVQGLQQSNSYHMRTGGNIRQNQMEQKGELKVYDGKAEPISYNHHLPDGGETVMFKGPSHEDGGMPIAYGNSPVEVEGGEPAVKLQDGSSGTNDLVVFGNLKIPNQFATLLGDETAKGKKFKNYIHDLSKMEAKQNKIFDKSMDVVNNLPLNTPFDKLKLNSQIANLTGADMKLKDAANKKMILASLQTEMNALKGGTRKAADGITIDIDTRGMKKPGTLQDMLVDLRAQANQLMKYDPSAVPSDFSVDTSRLPIQKGDLGTIDDAVNYFKTNKMRSPGYSDKTKKDISDMAMTVGNEIIPYVRPSDARGLDTRQLMGEMYALATNQVQPVDAQQFTPELSTPYDISFQDQLNRGVSDYRGAQRMMGYNPAAQSILAAQKYQGDQQILGEQFRANQAMRDKVYAENRSQLNQARLQNLGLLDQQYQRQAQALSNTKATSQAALNSVSSKLLQNELENRTLQAYENEYGYRFDQRGRAINMNQLFRPNIPNVANGKVPVVDNDGNIVAYQYVGDGKAKAKTETEPSRNGTVLKAFRNI